MTRSTSRELGPQVSWAGAPITHPTLAGSPGPEGTGTAQTRPASATVPAADYITGICKLGVLIEAQPPLQGNHQDRTEWCLGRCNACCFTNSLCAFFAGRNKLTPCLCDPRPLGAGSGEQGWRPLNTHERPAPLPHPPRPHPGRGPHGQSHTQEGTAPLASSREQEGQARGPGQKARPGSGLAAARTVWQKTTSRRYCRLRKLAMVGALSCMSRKTIAFLALSLIMATQSVRVVSSGYRASLHSPGQGRGG